jgi:hypothetical protein
MGGPSASTGLMPLAQRRRHFLLASRVKSDVPRRWRLPACIVATTLAITGCRSPFSGIRPDISASDKQRIAAMKSAPIIVLAEIDDAILSSQSRQVAKPPGIGGPMMPSIPLHLATVTAKSLLVLRGTAPSRLRFYSWVWASGKHGGPRLFTTSNGDVHFLFLKKDSNYLRTVGDYLAYDIRLPVRLVAPFIAGWHSGYEHQRTAVERLVAVGLRAELENIRTGQTDYCLSTAQLEELTSATFVTDQLNSLCESISNPVGRATACAESARRSSPHPPPPPCCIRHRRSSSSPSLSAARRGQRGVDFAASGTSRG